MLTNPVTMSSLQLRLSTSIHDSFLHVPSALFAKIQNKFLPLIQLDDNKFWTFWCIQDNQLSTNSVVLNSQLAEILGLKNYQNLKVSLGPFKSANIGKVIARLRNNEDWSFLNSNFDIIQSLILDQIRAVIRGEAIVIHSSLRKSPLILDIVEFGGYHHPQFIGIIGNDSQLEIITNDDANFEPRAHSIKFIAVPTNDFQFSASSIKTECMTMSFKEHTFSVIRDESVAPGVLKIPHVVLTESFKLKPKDEIELTTSKPQSNIDLKGLKLYTLDDSLDWDSTEIISSNQTSIWPLTDGLAIKTVESGTRRERYPIQKFEESNELFEFITGAFSKVTLFHGAPGSGKTKVAIDTVRRINFSDRLLSKAVYCDLLTSSFNPDFESESPTILILDHFDEFIANEDVEEARNRTALVKLIRQVMEFITLNKESRLVIVSRYSSFTGLSDITAILAIDGFFSLEKPDAWHIQINNKTIDRIMGLTEALKMLEKSILHPLAYSELYRANGMPLNSGVLISGPTGSGKTFLAQTFIDHHSIPCIQVLGPEILDKYVGSSERAVRDLFNRAKAIRPCVLFLDELDSLVPRRGSNQSGVTDRIVNQFLTELDGTGDRSGVFIIATSSRPDLIDPAITRAGRIDLKIELNYPKIQEINQFLETKNLGKRPIKSFCKITSENLNASISWADIVSLDWNNSSEALKNLLKIFAKKIESVREEDGPAFNLPQRLSLF